MSSSTLTAPIESLTLDSARSLTADVRLASRQLKGLGYEVRQKILRAIAAELSNTANHPAILEANQRDIDAAKTANMSGTNLARLVLTPKKLETLSAGLQQLSEPAYVADPVNQLKKETIIADGLRLQQRTVPLGVLLVIFESRPDVLPQLIGLSVLSSNGLLLKGGSESRHTLSVLYSLCTRAITRASDGLVQGTDLIALLSGRSVISTLLALDDSIDLVIPRGGKELVKHVKENTKIPVLGHADGVCHMYLDKEYGGRDNLVNMIGMMIDSKTDYPAACNALETLLLHESILEHQGLTDSTTAVGDILRSLQSAEITIKLGPRAHAHAQNEADSPFRGFEMADDLHCEYGDLTMCVELVPDMTTAIEHIHRYGSSHTETILTSNPSTASIFLDTVDSACVFHNTSTRFADGFRMGLGAEVGISTSRIHARGPVGVEGLCTTKWTMVSTEASGQQVKPFQTGEKKFIHKQIEVAGRTNL